MKRLRSEYILLAVFLTAVFSLSIIEIADPDTWTHLSFGKWIWEHKSIPTIEPFIETSQPFPYNNWLFGFLYYLAYLAMGFPGVVIMLALSVTATFAILLADSLKPFKSSFIAVIVLFIAVFLVRSRCVVRPDTFLMIFLPLSIFSLNAYVNDGKKYIYFLPLTHLLWANSHTSIPLMVIPFMAFIAGGFIQRQFHKKGIKFSYTPSYAQMKTIGLFFILSFVASLISPYFISQYTVSFQAIESDWWTQEIWELLPPTWDRTKQSYILAASILLSFALQWFGAYRSRKSEDSEYSSLVHLFLLVPFIYISFTAMRFVFFISIIGGPILIRNLSRYFISYKPINAFFRKKSVIALVILVIVAVSVLSIKEVEPIKQYRKHFGLRVSSQYFPEGALAYMEKNKITGKVYNLFQWGGYITWRGFPDIKPLIDGRGFTDNMILEEVSSAHNYSEAFDELEAKHGIDAALLKYELNYEGGGTINYDLDRTLRHPGWALVYWDDIASLYLKRGGKYDYIIKKDEYKFVRPSNVISATAARLKRKEYREQFIKELQRNIGLTGSSLAYASLGYVYNDVGRYKDAIAAYLHVRPHHAHDFTFLAYSGIAYAYGQLGDVDTALEYYLKSQEIETNPTTLYKIGLVYLTKGNEEEAVHYFEEALKGNKNMISVYPILIGTYKKLAMHDKAEIMSRTYEQAKHFGKAKNYFQAGLKAYNDREYDIAIREFNKAIEVNQYHSDSYSNIGYVYFDMGNMDKAYQYQKKSIDIDPNNANAHYGIALVYNEFGDKDLAIVHWKEYLRLQPSGYFSRKAKREIENTQ